MRADGVAVLGPFITEYEAGSVWIDDEDGWTRREKKRGTPYYVRCVRCDRPVPRVTTAEYLCEGCSTNQTAY